jgi:hypothetical protein
MAIDNPFPTLRHNVLTFLDRHIAFVEDADPSSEEYQGVNKYEWYGIHTELCRQEVLEFLLGPVLAYCREAKYLLTYDRENPSKTVEALDRLKEAGEDLIEEGPYTVEDVDRDKFNFLVASVNFALQDECDLEFKTDDAAATPDNPSVTTPAVYHTPDFRSVRWFSATYHFTGNQAKIVEVLWDAWKNGASDVSGAYLLTAADAQTKRLDHVFANGGHPAWGTMIVAGKTKATYRLNPPQ